ncbi:AlkP-core domain protein [Haloferax gibbonsii]|uniref:AlkP-core domain protein n=1 Tax=Haloferax gibbonsii TaxID=35746 RepID=A0A871BI66_HALGI|nr:sulfatase-like hydrolase/transferase [Haloferax gibbonsii]QOS12738.1 AlkP-core domain protein [Haloferax gibbonsii]
MESGHSFDNVLLFVSDSLRYDAVQRSLEQGVVKTIAAGTWSPPSFASIITGQPGPVHSVNSFDHKLRDDLPTIFDMAENVSFVNQGKQLGQVLGTETKVDEVSLEKIEPPFLYMERCLIPHAPYNHAEDDYIGSVRDYCISSKGNIQQDYYGGSSSSINKFKKRIKTLADRGLLDNTLVILTSDHGEILGEHGLFGHGSTTTPELVYVPTYIHNNCVDTPKDGITHIDLFPTIANIFDYELPGEYLGLDILQNNIPSDRLVFTQSKFGESSIWDCDGGYVFNDNSIIFSFGWWVHHLVRSPYAILNREHPVELFHTSMKAAIGESHVWGNPNFGDEAAKEYHEMIVEKSEPVTMRELDATSEDQLRDLGYI